MGTLALIVASGAAAGFAAGLFGIGGGLLIVPALALAFAHRLGAAPIMHLAVATSLAVIAPTAAASTWAHHRRGAVLWRDVARLGPAIAAGVVLGVSIAEHLPTQALARCFGAYALLVAVQLALRLRPTPRAASRVSPLPVASLAGLCIGTLSALIGVGGGTMITPYLLRRGRPMHNAVATSAACGLPVALIGSGAYMLAGWDNPALPPWTSGYVYWPAFALMTIAATALAPVGARQAHRLPETVLKRLFAALLAVIGVKMLVT